MLYGTRKDQSMQTPEEFLESNGLATRSLDRAGLVAAFQKEMEAGLAGEPSSLKMIPTFTSPYGDIEKDTPVTVLDAGGTNFRAGTVTIPSDGGDIKIEHVEKGEMPGAKSPVSQEDFYAVLTGHVKRCAPFTKGSAVGFCFSYPAEASAAGDAKLLHWTKQIQAPEIVGQWVGAEMAKRLDPAPSKITVVNDTVATLLAGKAIEKDVRYSAYLGFILGTGTNVAYIEKNENITKLKDAPAGSMAINTESGGFNKIEQSKFDEAMDKKTSDCGNQRFEKMISGAYLGRIGLEVFKAAAREGFFSEDAARELRPRQLLRDVRQRQAEPAPQGVHRAGRRRHGAPPRDARLRARGDPHRHPPRRVHHQDRRRHRPLRARERVHRRLHLLQDARRELPRDRQEGA